MVDLFNDLNKLYNFNELSTINKNNLPFLLKFTSNEPTNLAITTQLNKYLFWLNRDILKYALHFGLSKNKKYIQYLKPNKEEDEFEWLKIYIMEMYDWSERELKESWQVVKMLLKEDTFKKELDGRFGFNEEECKKLNIEYSIPLFEKEGLSEWL